MSLQPLWYRNFYFEECGDSLYSFNTLHTFEKRSLTPPPVGAYTSGVTKLGKRDLPSI